jgi:hypothetical protein
VYGLGDLGSCEEDSVYASRRRQQISESDIDQRRMIKDAILGRNGKR